MNEYPLNTIRDKLHNFFFENLERAMNNKPKLLIFKRLREVNYEIHKYDFAKIPPISIESDKIGNFCIESGRLK